MAKYLNIKDFIKPGSSSQNLFKVAKQEVEKHLKSHEYLLYLEPVDISRLERMSKKTMTYVEFIVSSGDGFDGALFSGKKEDLQSLYTLYGGEEEDFYDEFKYTNEIDFDKA